MYFSNAAKILNSDKEYPTEKIQQKVFRSNVTPNFLVTKNIDSFQSFRLDKKSCALSVNEEFNSSSDETKKIGFKRLNIINLLAKTNSNLYQQNGYSKEGPFETNAFTSLESPSGETKNTIKLHSTDRTSQSLPVSASKSSYFFRYSRVNEYKKLGVELASPDKIRKWAERLLPTGRIVGLVLNANTLHHKTLKPLKGGLFCERIFGPTKDFRCACGKTITKRTRMQNTTYSAGLINLLTPTGKPIKRFFCKICEVEYTWALTRRYQLGYISLAFPVTHLWYTKGFSSPISLLLDIHKYDLDSIIYCSQTTSLEKSYEITEMGISLQASQVLSSVRKQNNFSVKSNITLLQNVRKKNKALIQTRLHKRKKALELGFVLNASNVTLDATNITLPKKQNTETGMKSNFDILTKDISDFETLKQTLKAIKGSIEEISIKNFDFMNDQPEFKSKSANYLVLRANHYKDQRIVDGTQFFEQAIAKENVPSRLLQSLILPLIVTYSTQFFAPFVFWLLSFEANQKTSPRYSKNAHYTSTTLLPNLFTERFNTASSTSKDYNIIGEITHTLGQLKRIFTESLDTLENLPDIVERQYHKLLVNSRNKIQTLPVQTFGYINAHFYKEFYTVSIRQTNELLKKLKSTSYEQVDQFSVSDSDQKIDKKTVRTLHATGQGKLRYFLKQLKELFTTAQTNLDADGRNSNQISSLETTTQTNYTVQLNQLALHFFLYKLKKNQGTKSFSNNLRIPYLKTQNNNYLSGSKHASKSSIIKPTLSFYYNLYGIADDHLWDNINDWNLVKSYITIYPDVMDQVIPAYYHRIPNSSMTNFAKNQTLQETTSLIQQYKKLPKKYVSRYLQPIGVYENFEVSNSAFVKKTNTVNSDKAFDLYEKSSKNQQALPIKSTGAGIINILINSITLMELQAMDKHFAFLLKESRKTILTYKTKIKAAEAKYSIQSLPYSPVAKDSKEDKFSESFSNKQYLLYANNSSVQEQTSNQSSSQIIDIRRKTQPSARSDRYAGIDKFMEKHHDLLRRAKVVRKFAMTNVVPKAMILKVLPVLPPELRPIMKMADQIATSDLNRLYQRVLYRNERLNKIVLQLSESGPFGITSGIFDLANTTDSRKKQLEYDTKPTNELFETPLFGYEKHYAQRLLQEAVDNLIDNGRAGANTEKDAKGRALKSLSEVLKGKQGRFRQYLLGKRVDYSGRSVIVVGPKLKIHECGLPREMAVELYLPFIIQYLIQMKYTKTVVGAKTLIAREKELINSILENVVRGHPVILNRAPTLHRLGFQAFQPILVEGRAILLHPMACTAFNADFDGDQMAVHIPITIEARSEAWRLMLARNNLLSPATGEPIILPSQDMVLGCYYLTTTRKMKYEQLITSNQYFSDVETVLYLYYLGKLHLHTPVWVKTHKTVITDSTKKPLEIRLSVYGAIQEIYLNTEFYYDPQGILVHQYIRTTPGRILFNLIIKNS